MDVLQQCQTESVFQLPPHSSIYDLLLAIKDFYKPIHTYLSIVLCALGAVCNFCNIVVLTRKTMRTPVNMILTAMACCDTVVLFSNLTYTTHYTFVAFEHCIPRHWSYGWCVFLISHAHLSLVGHSSSIWLSVMLALIRYMTLRRRGKASGGVQIGLKHSYLAIACVVLFVSVMNAPNFLTYKITEQTLGETCGELAVRRFRNHTAYVPGVADLALKADCLVFRLAFWITGAVFKLFPCLLLTLLVSLLTRILKEVRANRQRLFLSGLQRSATFETPSSQLVEPASSQTAVLVFPTDSKRNGGAIGGGTVGTTGRSPSIARSAAVTNHTQQQQLRLPSDSVTPSPLLLARDGTLRNRGKTGSTAGFGPGGAQRPDRTTRMLLAIVCVFLVTELPQGIMAVMSGMFSEEFRSHIYNNLGDILDLLSLCNALSTFTIYCTMSAQFRNEFRRVFVPTTRRVKSWRHRLLLWTGQRRRMRTTSAETTPAVMGQGEDGGGPTMQNTQQNQQRQQQAKRMPEDDDGEAEEAAANNDDEKKVLMQQQQQRMANKNSSSNNGWMMQTMRNTANDDE